MYDDANQASTFIIEAFRYLIIYFINQFKMAHIIDILKNYNKKKNLNY